MTPIAIPVHSVFWFKDQLTAGLQPPTYRSYRPAPPTVETFQRMVEEFFSDAPYVAKCLWRDELLPASLWSQLEAAYADAALSANWDALLRTMALFRQVAMDVAAQLGYTYPLAMDEGVTAYVERVRRLDCQ